MSKGQVAAAFVIELVVAVKIAIVVIFKRYQLHFKLFIIAIIVKVKVIAIIDFMQIAIGCVIIGYSISYKLSSSCYY